MPSSARWSSRQLAVAKCIVILLVAGGAGVTIADAPGKRGVSIAAMLVLVGGSAAAYELIARGLAVLIARIRLPWSPPPQSTASHQEPSDTPRRKLRSWQPFAALGAYLGAASLVWLGGVVVASARLGPHAPKAAVGTGLLYLTPVLLPAGEAASGLAVLVALRRWAQRLDEASFLAVAPRTWGTRRQFAVGGGAGLALGIAFLLVSRVIAYHPAQPPSLIVQAASTPGATRWAWIVSALLLAPPIEEAQFRGVLLGGLARASGLPAAVLLSGLTFWLLHASEWLTYWPAAVALGTLTVLVTVLRVRTQALGASMAAHFAYNLALVVAAFGHRFQGAA